MGESTLTHIALRWKFAIWMMKKKYEQAIEELLKRK